MSLLFLRLTIALYSIGLLHSFLTIITRKKTLFRVALFGICSGFVTHALSILFTWLETEHPPVTSYHPALSFFAFVIVLAFLVSYLRYRLDSLSVFVFPLVFILTLAAALIAPSQQPLPERNLWFYVHIPTIFFGYAAFGIAFAASIMYLIQENELKRKRPQAFYYRLPSLEICDELGYKSLSVGFPLLTIGITAGALWANKAPGSSWGWDPKIIWSFITWLTYAVLIHYRLYAGLRGRRAAFMSILGFVFVLFTFLGSRYLGSHHPFVQR